MWLIAGLGNPGSQYALTRHNIGFMALDVYSQSIGSPTWSQEHKAETLKIKIEGQSVLLAKPMTFMNLSGESIVALMNFYKIDPEKVLILHDEIDIGFGWLRFHKNRSAGGHNGIRSISELLGHNNYTRLRLGVGRPTIPQMAVSDFVLQKFSKEEEVSMPEFLNIAGDAMEAFVLQGLSKASSLFNGDQLKKNSPQEASKEAVKKDTKES